jgi:surface protein
MFQDCHELEYLDLSNVNTSKVNDMRCMFNECYKLKEIKGIENFNTNQVTNMETMLQNCTELEYLDLSNFNTSKDNDMG